MAESMCARAALGQHYFQAARKHAQRLLNLRQLRGRSKSREEEVTGRKPNLRKDMPYIFGCTVLVLRDADDRGPIGTLERGRTYVARYLGVEGSGHVVEKLDTGKICYPSHCVPLNEHEMVRDSLPAGAALHSTESQTIGSEFPALSVPPQPRVPTSSPAPTVVPIAHELPPIGNVSHANVPDGRSMDEVSLLYGGWESTVDGIKQRFMARYPRANVAIDDIKGGVDFTTRDARKAYLAKLKAGKVKVCFAATPCSTYSPCSGIQLRSFGEINGISNLDPDLYSLLKRHNALSAFTEEVLEYCDAHGIQWGVEC